MLTPIPSQKTPRPRTFRGDRVPAAMRLVPVTIHLLASELEVLVWHARQRGEGMTLEDVIEEAVGEVVNCVVNAHLYGAEGAPRPAESSASPPRR